jgi:CRISPR-associated endonuclease/helicase Cas3
MRVQGYVFKQVAVEGVQTRLYPHQAAMLNEWSNQNGFLLVTKTGSGKTRATALPVMKNQESAIFVYPTNALIQDQSRAIQQLMEDEGIAYRELTPQNVNEKFGGEDYHLVQVSAPALAAFAKAWGMGEKQKGVALLRLLQQDKRKIVLINPDILYLLYSLRYRASQEALAHFQAYTTVVFDEFHLYNGVELAHALFLIHFARRMQAFKRVVLLSATPNAEVRTHLDRLLAPCEVDASVTVSQPICGERAVAHDVNLQPLPVGTDIVETAQAKVRELIDELRHLRTVNNTANADGDYVPCVVILNSVVNAIALEDALVEAGIPRTDIAPIRGLSARSSRDVRGKLLVLGTAAIEVGIDFKTDYLIFEAGDVASFMQRFGRIGRHSRGNAFLLANPRECQAVMSLGDDISREDLERGVTAIYPSQDAKGWFIDTLCGAYTVIAQADNFRRRVMDDWSAGDEMKAEIDGWLNETLESYATQMKLSQMKRAQFKVRRHPSWFEHYKEIDSFRTSLPNQEVWDVREKENERDWSYDADVKMLLTRAERLWFNEKHGRLYVKGYGRYRRVWFAKSFEDEREADCCGILRTTANYPPGEMQFMQEGHLTSVSHVMAKPQHHLFVLAPADIIPALDWRLTWFRCGSTRGKYIIAFDGDALLLKEIYERFRKASQ